MPVQPGPSDSPDHDELFVVLGFLDEYLGRLIEAEGDYVERFFENEIPEADLFEQWLSRLRESRHVAEVIRREQTALGIYFRCRDLSALINAQYQRVESTGFRSAVDRGRYSGEVMAAFITPGLFERAERRTKLSYLAGAYARYGEDSLFIFANAKHKAEVVLGLLKELGCEDLRLELTNPGYIPNRWDVAFRMTDELKQWFSL